MTKYRTIVADPPWQMASGGQRVDDRPGRVSRNRPSRLPYGTMSLKGIKSIPVQDWAEDDAHLYLWTVNGRLEDAFSVARAWGFSYSQPVVWCKPPSPLGGVFGSSTEFVLFCRRGTLPAPRYAPQNWFTWPKGEHSAKPDAFYDLVEQVSPGPYLEMFARRARLGDWHYYGNESLETAEVEKAA